MQNRLAATTSPYLIQHADNPVHWQPWDQTALDAAKAADKPILLSIGYAACHWCHVMAHESFESGAIADLMNGDFINIKVDREERPDLDQIYQRALALQGEQGGWPLTMFLTPAGEPFWGGTYFPPDARFGRPGFPDVLKEIARIWQDERYKVENNKTALKDALGQLAKPRASEDGIEAEILPTLAAALAGAFDATHGGLGGAPKFPQAPILGYLWHQALLNGHRTPGHRTSGDQEPGDQASKDAVIFSLQRMSQGGIYDHLGGGYARYAVDERWLVPHFEKMLYDNALLLGLLAEVHASNPSPLFEARAKETVGWLQREMIAEKAFAASLDADSEGEEGKFYVWDEAEIETLLNEDDAAAFKRAFDVQPGGNWEGKTILNRLHEPGLASPAEEAKLQASAAILLRARGERIRPGRDDKVLADWNGLMITALAKASAAFEQPGWLELAIESFETIMARLQDGDRLRHSFRGDQRLELAFLDDYAAMAEAAVTLFQHTGEPAYLDKAERWIEILDQDYRDQAGGGYFQASLDAHDLVVRPKTAMDGPTPSGNGLLATVLASLHDLTGKAHYQERLEELLTLFAGEIRAHPTAHTTLLKAFAMHERPIQIVLIGNKMDQELRALQHVALAAALPGMSVLQIEPDKALPALHPANGKAMVEGKPTAYLCINRVCQAPLTDPDALEAALSTTIDTPSLKAHHDVN